MKKIVAEQSSKKFSILTLSFPLENKQNKIPQAHFAVIQK